jgi:hypothetical protein
MVSNAFNLANVAPNTSNSNVSVTGFNANVAVGQYINAANVQVTNAILFADGSQLTSAVNSMSIYDYTGDGVTTSFSTGNYSASTTLNTQIFIGGVYQRKNQYTWTGTNITFNTPPPNGANIEIELSNLPNTLNVPATGSVYPSTLSTGGPSWDITGNLTATGNLFATSYRLTTNGPVTGNGLFLVNSNTLMLATGGSNAMVLDAAQRVGVGTAIPGNYGAKINTLANDNAYGYIASGANGLIRIAGYATATQGAVIDSVNTNQNAGSNLSLMTNNVERLRVTNTGNVIIGNLTVSSALASNAFVAGNGLFFNSANINANAAVTATFNALSVGPIYMAPNVNVTVAAGQRWVIL